MDHCVGSYWPQVERGTARIFSLRDTKNKPHATVELEAFVGTRGRRGGTGDIWLSRQEQGVANSELKPAYRKRVDEWKASSENVGTALDGSDLAEEWMKWMLGTGRSLGKRLFLDSRELDAFSTGVLEEAISRTELIEALGFDSGSDLSDEGFNAFHEAVVDSENEFLEVHEIMLM